MTQPTSWVWRPASAGSATLCAGVTVMVVTSEATSSVGTPSVARDDRRATLRLDDGSDGVLWFASVSGLELKPGERVLLWHDDKRRVAHLERDASRCP